MLIERVEHEQWLSNAYLVVDEQSGEGALVDGNGLMEPLLERAEQEGARIGQILITHDHHDHVAGLEELRERLGAAVLASEETAGRLGFGVDRVLGPGERFPVGSLEARAISTPGHASGHLAFLVGGTDCFTGDSLFKGTVAGTLAPGATGFEDLRASIMERLLELPPETRLHPGHREPTTVAEEWEGNPFVRIWRGVDPEGTDRCRVFGDREATLVLWAPDYDGTNKAWVRFDDGTEGIVGGSQVNRAG